MLLASFIFPGIIFWNSKSKCKIRLNMKINLCVYKWFKFSKSKWPSIKTGHNFIWDWIGGGGGGVCVSAHFFNRFILYLEENSEEKGQNM